MEAPRRPATVRLTLMLFGLLTLLGLLAVVLVRVLNRNLVLSWAEGHREAREIVQTAGLDYLIDEQPIAVPQFFPVTLVLFIVLVLLLGVLTLLFFEGNPWARYALTAVLLLVAVGTGAAIRVAPPATFVALGVAGLVVIAGILVAAWTPPSSRFLHDTRRYVHS
ncbi:hypothetical protein [Nocardioides bruguierae]|uniref:Uncharacterized protein n=1 Tax=Nocardioides bruguierae TaxID=2945102 RepID=A0A9X2D9I3_9ACTN|nr:hypothetical protein [Nocardioides bruguierae]MCL8027008.1 hypothetical protein [Nocardioides bruguierae]MCM0621635.1 hypothetical protein [Nocardioides bruguierae]